MGSKGISSILFAFAKHILNSGYKYGKMEDIMDIIDYPEKREIVNIKGNFYVYLHNKIICTDISTKGKRNIFFLEIAITHNITHAPIDAANIYKSTRHIISPTLGSTHTLALHGSNRTSRYEIVLLFVFNVRSHHVIILKYLSFFILADI
jgi:hypothetical protein